jgi:hypothetical protein
MSHTRADNPSIFPVARSFVSWLVVGAINSQHAFNPTDNTANGPADDGAHRTRAAIALINAMGDAAGNSLRMGDDGHRDDCNDRGRNQNS